MQAFLFPVTIALMNLGLEGKRALLWGASRGLGHACALALAREGVQVTLAARTRETLEAAAAAIRNETGVAAGIVVADITTEAGRAAALAACPQPDILLNNADGPMPGDFRDWTRDDWLAALDAMMLGPIAMIRATVDGMIERRFGRILNIASRSVKIPQLELGLSNGARSGLVGFTGGLARQVVRHNVTINNLLPGIFATDGQRRHLNGMVHPGGRSFDELWQERAKNSPAQRYGEPGEFGAYCAFLCSAHAGYITGQNLLVDGGSYPGTF
jgi:3-oxoacyl-[acyl-carrier protein] reductase